MRFCGTFVTVDRNDADRVNKLLRHACATVTEVQPKSAATDGIVEVNYEFTAESYRRALGVTDRPEADFSSVMGFCEMLGINAEPCELELPAEGWTTVYKGRADLYQKVEELRKKPDPKFERIDCSGRSVTIRQYCETEE